jgi:hypothetical protein
MENPGPNKALACFIRLPYTSWMNSESSVLKGRLTEIESTIAALQHEAGSIKQALLIVERYMPKATEQTTSSTGEKRVGSPRPKGTPSLFDMTTFVLRDAGTSGLTGSEIVGQIRGKYWPGAAGSQIQPSLYRFLKEGRIHKIDGRFALINEKTLEKEFEPEMSVSGSNGV